MKTAATSAALRMSVAPASAEPPIYSLAPGCRRRLMASVKLIPIFAAAALFVGQPAHAQFTYITPNGSGGYMMNTPGAPNPFTYVTPNGSGGYMMNTPGYQPNNAPMFPRYGR